MIKSLIKTFLSIVLLSLVLVFTGIYIRNTLNQKLEILEIIPKIYSGIPYHVRYSHPLMIEVMRKWIILGSKLDEGERFTTNSNYTSYIASYKSSGLKINALLTIPAGEMPEEGWPAIVFNHGYIPPDQYRTTQRYEAYIDYFASNGYVVLKPDYRGHGDSEGKPEGAYFSPAYTIDVLNAYETLRRYDKVNPEKIGMWGHSMGGHITLRAMVVNPEIKVGVIWAGVVASYEDLFTKWRRDHPRREPPRENMSNRPTREDLAKEYGDIKENLSFWESISPIYFVDDISGPIQIHHGTEDQSVPWEFSQSLKEALDYTGKEYEYYLYEGADHNISGVSFNAAMKRSLDYFDEYLK